MRTRSVPLRRSFVGRRFFPPSVGYEASLGFGEQGALHFGQGSFLEGFDGLLYAVEGVQVALQAVGAPSSSVGEKVALVVFEDDADAGHGGFVSFDSPPAVK